MSLDDSSPIDDSCIAYRLVRPDWVKPNSPPTAVIFQDHPEDGYMSVFLADKMADDGVTVEQLAAKLPGYRVCEISVADLRRHGEIVTRNEDPFFPGHANCKNDNGKRTNGTRNKIAGCARWTV